MDRNEVRNWILKNPEEAKKVLEEVAHEQEIMRLKGQLISYGKKLAKLEAENNSLKTKLGMPVVEKKKKSRFSERLANAENNGA